MQRVVDVEMFEQSVMQMSMSKNFNEAIGEWGGIASRGDFYTVFNMQSGQRMDVSSECVKLFRNKMFDDMLRHNAESARLNAKPQKKRRSGRR